MRQQRALTVGRNDRRSWRAVIGVGVLVAGLGVTAAAYFGVFSAAAPTAMTAWRHAPWNEDAQAARVARGSEGKIEAWLARGNVRYPSVSLTNGYAFAWVHGTGSDPHYTVRITTYHYPLETSIPIPRGTRPAPGGDAHLTIFDTEHGEAHDLWRAAYDARGDTWSAASGVSYPIGGSPPPGTGSTAAGVPALALAIWPEEIKAGVIRHALAFTAVHIAPDVHRYPATHTDGHGTGADLAMGSWLRMPASVAADAAWPAWVKAVFVALQRYGMYLVDSGGALAVYGVDPINGGLHWSDVGISGSSAAFPSDFPWGRLQLLEPPAGSGR